MKGLSLTLTVIVVAVALLVTVLVIITIFGGQMASFLGILNPWSEEVLIQSQCNSKCASWCQTHVGEKDTGWGDIPGTMTYKGESKTCSQMLGTVGLPDRCSCTLTTGGVTTPAAGAKGAICSVPSSPCTAGDTPAGTKDATVASSICTSTTCKIVCTIATRRDGTCA